MKYLLDTNTCIQFLNQRSQKLIDRLTDMPDGDLCVCSVVQAEMFYGAQKSARRERNLTVQRAFFARYVSLPFDDAAAETYALIRADLEGRGQPIGANDLLIAAIALAHDSDAGDPQRVRVLAGERTSSGGLGGLNSTPGKLPAYPGSPAACDPTPRRLPHKPQKAGRALAAPAGVTKSGARPRGASSGARVRKQKG